MNSQGQENIIGYILVIFILFITMKIYYDSDIFQLKCIVSTVDGNKYCVRERKNMKKAADLLASTTKKMKYFVDTLYKK